jgi:hypothetical protein
MISIILAHAGAKLLVNWRIVDGGNFEKGGLEGGCASGYRSPRANVGMGGLKADKLFNSNARKRSWDVISLGRDRKCEFGWQIYIELNGFEG